jgi:thiamine-phosphate pyrophosphorylase
VSILNKLRRAPILCYVTDRHLFGKFDFDKQARKTLLGKIEAAASAGVDWIQIREKDLCGRDCARLARDALRSVAKSSAASRARLLVNDRLDVALSEGTDGVHLGEHGLPVSEAKRLRAARARQKNFLIGVSCHSLEAAKSAERDGADYIFFGPVFATPSKSAYGPPQGLECLAQISSAVLIPVIAIGGITVENASRCLGAGAAGLAAIRLFQETENTTWLVRKLREATS